MTRAVNVAYLGPSITTESYLNPGYRIYTVDGFYRNSSWQILDFETKYLNLTEANAYNVTKWRTEYTARVSFGSVFTKAFSFKFSFDLLTKKGRLRNGESISAKLERSHRQDALEFGQWSFESKTLQVRSPLL